MELSELLSKAGSLPEVQQRKVAAILGSLVADAASQPIHWVYKDEDLAKAVEGINPEFLPKSINNFYIQTTGQQSPYGDLLIVMLESLAACKGFDAKDSAKRIFEAFGPGSPFDNDASALYSPGMTDMSMFPIQGKWRNPLLARFSNLHVEGKKVEDMLEEDLNVDPDNIPRLVPLVALLAGKPNMFETAYDAAAQLQKSDLILTTVMAACRLMQQYILDGASVDVSSLEKVIEDLKKPDRAFPLPLDRAMSGQLKDVLDTRGLDVTEAAKKFGKICDLPGSLQAAVRCLLDDTDYVSVVRAAMLGGGCNCSRVSFIGACLGAKYGLSSIPLEWIQKTDSAKHALELAVELAQL